MARLHLVALSILLVGSTALGQQAGRTTSSSGQFVIYSKDPEWRTAASRRADDARLAWQKWLGSNSDWAHPIIIQDLRRSPRPSGNLRASTAIFESDGGALKVQTDIYDSSVMGSETFEMEIFRAMGLERIYRKNPVRAGKPFHQLPAWIAEGMTQALRVEKNGIPDGVYAALLSSERPPKIEDFLKSKPELMEATSMTLYRTQALALLRALRQLPEGAKGLDSLVESLHEEDGGLKTIFAAYPSLSSDSAQLGKIWTLAIARGSSNRKLEMLSIGETNRALATIFEISGPADPKKPDEGMLSGAAAMPAIARGAGGPFFMRQKAGELLNLEFRAHPVMKPVVAEYRAIASELAAKPRKNVTKRIEETDQIRSLLQQRSGNVADYLNWFEATQLDMLSEGTLEVSDPPTAQPRGDALTRQIDALERRGW